MSGEHPAAANALEQAREDARFREQLLNAVGQAVIATDLAGRITYWNRSAEELYGWTAEEALGRSVLEIVVSEETAQQAAEIMERLVAGASWSGEFTVRRRDGTTFPAHVSDTPILDEDGVLVGVIGVSTDITERKRAERELRRTLQNLRVLDGQRRRLLARLVDAQESERSRIAGDIHDDSIQVMSAVGIRLDSLRRRIDDPTSEQRLLDLQRTVQEAITRLRQLIFEVRPSGLDRGGLGAALEELLTATEEDGEHAFELRSTLDEPIPERPRAVAFRIAQEAIKNVSRHAPGARIDLELDSRDGGVHTRIRDDGPGFDPHKGSAGHLGLASMRERAEMAGGWFRVESAPGAGTGIEFWIPAGA